MVARLRGGREARYFAKRLLEGEGVTHPTHGRRYLHVVTVHLVLRAHQVAPAVIVGGQHERLEAVAMGGKVADAPHRIRHVAEHDEKTAKHKHEAGHDGTDERSVLFSGVDGG